RPSSEIAALVGLYSSTNLFVNGWVLLPPRAYTSLITTSEPSGAAVACGMAASWARNRAAMATTAAPHRRAWTLNLPGPERTAPPLRPEPVDGGRDSA